MKVVSDFSHDYNDCIIQYLELEDFDDGNEDTVLFYGYGSYRNYTGEEYKNSKKVCLQFEQPCGFMDNGSEPMFHFNIADKFDVVYTTCPLTGKWLNKYKSDKYKFVKHPHNKKYAVDKEYRKILDSVYWGNFTSNDHLDIARAMSKGKNKAFTLGSGLMPEGLNLEVNVPRKEMWEHLRGAMVMPTANLLYINDQHIRNIKTIPNWEDNEAFSHIDQGIIPQIKTRPIEAVFNKVIPLIKRDPWNLYSMWFEEGEHFFYYDTEEELTEMITDISANWEKYKPMTQKAFDLAMKLYTTDKLMETISCL